jgi:hypothetical protein
VNAPVNFVWPFCEVSAEEVDICEAEPQDVLERCQADGGVWALTDITDIESTNGICSVTALGTSDNWRPETEAILRARCYKKVKNIFRTFMGVLTEVRVNMEAAKKSVYR